MHVLKCRINCRRTRTYSGRTPQDDRFGRASTEQEHITTRHKRAMQGRAQSQAEADAWRQRPMHALPPPYPLVVVQMVPPCTRRRRSAGPPRCCCLLVPQIRAPTAEGAGSRHVSVSNAAAVYIRSARMSDASQVAYTHAPVRDKPPRCQTRDKRLVYSPSGNTITS